MRHDLNMKTLNEIITKLTVNFYNGLNLFDKRIISVLSDNDPAANQNM